MTERGRDDGTSSPGGPGAAESPAARAPLMTGDRGRAEDLVQDAYPGRRALEQAAGSSPDASTRGP